MDKKYLINNKIDNYWCDHCDDFTDHWIIRESTHERDSSEDFWKCTICLWEYSGYSGKYSPPYED